MKILSPLLGPAGAARLLDVWDGWSFESGQYSPLAVAFPDEGQAALAQGLQPYNTIADFTGNIIPGKARRGTRDTSIRRCDSPQQLSFFVPP